MNKYCLGYTHTKCETCQHEKNWQTLNQMPDALRRPLQANMSKVNSDKCRMTHIGEHQEQKGGV